MLTFLLLLLLICQTGIDRSALPQTQWPILPYQFENNSSRQVLMNTMQKQLGVQLVPFGVITLLLSHMVRYHMPRLVAWQGHNELINKIKSTVTWPF